MGFGNFNDAGNLFAVSSPVSGCFLLNKKGDPLLRSPYLGISLARPFFASDAVHSVHRILLGA
jgi:hypothetical protein